jgi:hypothetical protein
MIFILREEVSKTENLSEIFGKSCLAFDLSNLSVIRFYEFLKDDILLL